MNEMRMQAKQPVKLLFDFSFVRCLFVAFMVRSMMSVSAFEFNENWIFLENTYFQLIRKPNPNRFFIFFMTQCGEKPQTIAIK